eukprot:g52348.t1
MVAVAVAVRPTAAPFTLIVVGDAGGALYWSKTDAEKPDYEGDRAKPRAEEKQSKKCFNCKRDHLIKDCRVRGPVNNRNKSSTGGRNLNRKGANPRNGRGGRPTGKRFRGRNYNTRAAANMVKEIKQATHDEVDDAWIGMAVDNNVKFEAFIHHMTEARLG